MTDCLRSPLKNPLSIAPMMDWTDRHYRFFMRQITKHTLLYTEMITTGAIIHGDEEKHLAFSALEHPLALQLGGDDPAALAHCANIAEGRGYDEVNLNVGCPSDRVQRGAFGACLMARPELVRDCVAAMKAAVTIPVTVKHRIGIDDVDSYDDMQHFVAVVSEAGADKFTVHARKAWLQGLSPKENRTIPPLRYADVYRLKEDFPHLRIEINGGIKDFTATQEHLAAVDAVMIGRAAYENPYLFARADALFYNDPHEVPSRREVIAAMLPYIAQCLAQDIYLRSIARHMLQLFSGQQGARAWKRHLSENMHQQGAGLEVILEAMQKVPDTVLDARAL